MSAAGKSWWKFLSAVSTPTQYFFRGFLAGKVVLPSYITVAASTLCAVGGTCNDNIAVSHREDGFFIGRGGGTEA